MSRWYCSVKGAEMKSSFLPTFLCAFLPSFFILPPSPSTFPSPTSSTLCPSLTQSSSHFSFVLCAKFSEIQVYFLWFLPKAISLYSEEHGRARLRGHVDENSHPFFWNLPLTRYQIHTYPSYAFYSADFSLVQNPCRSPCPVFWCFFGWLVGFIICAFCVTWNLLLPIWSSGVFCFQVLYLNLLSMFN